MSDALREEVAVGFTFAECFAACAMQKDFVAEIDRLRGTHFAEVFATMGRATPLESDIDEATGRFTAELQEFAVIVHDLVWSRMKPNADGAT